MLMSLSYGGSQEKEAWRGISNYLVLIGCHGVRNYANDNREEVHIFVEHIGNETQNIEFVEFIEGCTNGGVENEVRW